MEDGSGAKTVSSRYEGKCMLNMNKGGTTGNARPFVHVFFYLKGRKKYI